MCAFDRPSEGDLTWSSGGQSLNAMEVPTRMAYCAPDQGLISDLDVIEHIALHQRLRRPIAETQVEQVLELALLADKANVRVRDLSSGMRQRLSLALAFSTNSNALFLDEPTSHLDRPARLGTKKWWPIGATDGHSWWPPTTMKPSIPEQIPPGNSLFLEEKIGF